MNEDKKELWTVSLDFKEIISKTKAESISTWLEEIAISISLNNNEAADGDNWSISFNCIGELNKDSIFNILENKESGLISKNNINIKKSPNIDWLEYVHNKFPPVKTNKFFIYGSHYKGNIPNELIYLQIDAVTAFGSGEHETTRGCIESIEYLIDNGHKFKNALDMGCGSGILSIALAKLLNDIAVTAIDIDLESVEVTKRYIKMNNVAENIKSSVGDGYKTDLVAKNAPYDIIISNILANPLINMSEGLNYNLKSGGFCILSGFLEKQQDEVVKAHIDKGLLLVKSFNIGEWQAVIMQKEQG